MSATINMESSGRFGTAFHKALVEKGMTLVEFARQIDANYEHLRKVFKGITYPSKRMLEVICKPLKLNVAQMEVLLAQDRMEKKLGKKAFNAASGRNEHASEFDALLPHMSEGDINLIIAQMKTMVKQKKVRDRG
jgi:predicted transcriptional regulator